MSPPGRPKGEYWSAQHEGSPVSAEAVDASEGFRRVSERLAQQLQALSGVPVSDVART
jgi:hypothetical protein